ncbi:zinc-alpha-2-glycoprotein [Chanos chanos]|uniref:Zinc-alpha-2-glycoprotein n=1 Tax=Chanos chanos TaxID=29144 RepID=A0A6J2UPI5_CHACN|nr:zinc-alpha-2-glycoprotein-like [Chanos chanos]
MPAGENAYQQYIVCPFNQTDQRGHLWRYGYNSKDILHVDLTSKTVVAKSKAGKFLAEERKEELTGYIKSKQMKLDKICSAVRTVFALSNNSLSRAAKPTVQVSLKGPPGHEFLSCLVRGFHPDVIRVQWSQHGTTLYYGTSTTGLLPHMDGTFQMTSFLSLANRTFSGISCEIEHISLNGKMKVAWVLLKKLKKRKKALSVERSSSEESEMPSLLNLPGEE